MAEQNHLGNFGRGHYEEHFYENILNSDKWLSRCLKYFLSRALAAILFGGAEPFGQFRYRVLGGTFMLSYFRFSLVV